jgi:dTMP kinase
MSASRQRGVFIAFEGGEGTGKSTQVRLLADALRERGHSVEITREPGGTPRAEKVRELLLHPPGEGWTPEAEALLFAAARADHVARLIRPALARGCWVLSDRFIDSSRAYQGGAGGLGDAAITSLHAFGSEGMRPDMTLLLEVDDATRASRLAARDGEVSDAIGGRSADYHEAVARSFRDIADAEPNGFRVIDGSGTQQEVHERILAALEPFMDEPDA